MAKISPVSIKYMIHATFSAEGRLEKPDVIGAIFGQTEGLLGSDLEMRELQKEGKIGRIDVELSHEGSKTTGSISIPSALDKAETTIIGAAIETIERIGPSDSKIEVSKVEDVRGSKRDYILERAKKLLEQIDGNNDSGKEIADSIKTSVKIDKLQEYGDEKLPSGDLSGDEVIVVEGRADVINLLKNNVSNVIAMNGTKLPEAVKELSKSKTIILFVDGDRGGKLIVRNVMDNASVNFVAFAPDGKEVEELTGKEILQALRKKVSSQSYESSYSENRDRGYGDRRSSYSRGGSRPRSSYSQDSLESFPFRELSTDDIKKINSLAGEVSGKGIVLIINDKIEIISSMSVRSASTVINRTEKPIFCVIVDGNATPSIIRASESRGIHYIAAKGFSRMDTKIRLLNI